MRKHKFTHEQVVEVQSGEYPPLVQVVALCGGHCHEHQAPMYGCVRGGDSFTFCEELLRPLSKSHREKMN